VEMLFQAGLPALFILLLLFLSFRLGFLSSREIDGRGFFLSGAVILVIVCVLQFLTLHRDYSAWFIEEAYFWIDGLRVALVGLGILLLAIGLSLYSDFWQSREDSLAKQRRRLGLLDSLQRDAREPYQLIEFLNILLKEILTTLPDSAGAVYLMNRQRRQLVMACAYGVSQKETASLERYPFGRNLVSQAIDIGEPTIGGDFSFIEGNRTVESRFRSALVLPMISGRHRLGAVVLLSETRQAYSNNETEYLAPVAEWIAEKVHSTRLERELSIARDNLESMSESRDGLLHRLSKLASAFGEDDSIELFCRALVGLHGCSSTHLAGMVDGSLVFHGGSEPIDVLGENYKTALIDALGRDKPLIVNQEAVTEEGRSYIAHATLVVPVKDQKYSAALMLRRSEGTFRLGDDDLTAVGLYADLAAEVLRQSEGNRLDITRRKGLHRILRMLRFDSETSLDASHRYLTDNLAEILPEDAGVVMFTRQPDGTLRSEAGYGVNAGDLSEFEIMPGEGFLGKVGLAGESGFVHGRKNVQNMLATLELSNREIFYRMFAEKGVPAAFMTAPLYSLDRVVGIATVFFREVDESETSEWDRLLTLAFGLYSFRLTIDDLKQSLAPVEPGELDGNVMASVINRMNNHLSAIVGNAELGFNRPELGGDARRHFESIIVEAEQASNYFRDSFSRLGTSQSETESGVEGGRHLNDFLTEILHPARISGNLYMIGGSPREVELELHPVIAIDITAESLQPLVMGALDQIASLAQEKEVLSVSTYRLGRFVYLDISRHSKDLPGITRQAGIGEYMLASEAARTRPDDRFLEHARGGTYYYSFDKRSHNPTFLSFKFPVRSEQAVPESSVSKEASILAIDDQEVILDLIMAMCSSLGYSVETASSAEAGLRKAQNRRFDIVLTDLAMPGQSGLEVAGQIKRLHPETSIVLITGWEVSLDKEQLDRQGISRILHKPFRIEQLTEVLKSVAASNSIS